MAATLRAVLRHGMTPIVCVGETEEEREDGETEARLTAQIDRRPEGPAGRAGGRPGRRLRAHLGHRHRAHGHRPRTPRRPAPTSGPWWPSWPGTRRPPAVRIQYGGSVRPENTAELMGQPDVDGALVGGASLDAATFAAIVQAAAGATVAAAADERPGPLVALPGPRRPEEDRRC